jgi:hypothetical protein
LAGITQMGIPFKRKTAFDKRAWSRRQINLWCNCHPGNRFMAYTLHTANTQHLSLLPGWIFFGDNTGSGRNYQSYKTLFWDSVLKIKTPGFPWMGKLGAAQ